MRLVSFPKTNLNDLPGQLRRLASQLESGEAEAESIMIMIIKDGRYPGIRMLGPATHAERIYQLNLTLYSLLSPSDETPEPPPKDAA